jgi:hypothetical protein
MDYSKSLPETRVKRIKSAKQKHMDLLHLITHMKVGAIIKINCRKHDFQNDAGLEAGKS